MIGRPLVLLRFHAPEYDISDGRGIVQWRIQDGLLVSKRNEGYLEIDVKRMESDRQGYARVHVEVEVANFYPAIATFIARWVYVNTQSRIHVLVTHGFLRSLAKLELEESAVGRFAEGSASGRSTSATRPGRASPCSPCSQQRSRHPCDFDERGVRRRAGADGVDEAVEEPAEAAHEHVARRPRAAPPRRPRPRRAAGRSRR